MYIRILLSLRFQTVVIHEIYETIIYLINYSLVTHHIIQIILHEPQGESQAFINIDFKHLHRCNFSFSFP